MEYKPEWEAAKEHYRDWWNGVGTVLVVTAPRSEPMFDAPVPEIPDDPEDRWLNVEFRIRQSEYTIAHTFYGGDAFPCMNHYMGPGCFALYLGCDADFSDCTGKFDGMDNIWFGPIIDDIEKPPSLPYGKGDYYWSRHLGMIKSAKERAAGRYEVGIPDLVENLDVLASLRGTSRLLLDMVDSPAAVHRMQRQLLELYFRYYDAIYDVVKGKDGGCSFQTYHVWAGGRMAKVQCDLGSMISPAMFREFVIPYLTEQCDRLDYSMFHLDGPDCLCHVDALMEIDSLNAIQWVPGAGEAKYGTESCGNPKWYPLYEKVRMANKSLQLHGLQPDEIDQLFRHFGPDGFYVSTSFRTEAEARVFVEKFEDTWRR